MPFRHLLMHLNELHLISLNYLHFACTWRLHKAEIWSLERKLRKRERQRMKMRPRSLHFARNLNGSWKYFLDLQHWFKSGSIMSVTQIMYYLFSCFSCDWNKHFCVSSCFAIWKRDAMLLVNSCQSVFYDVCIVGDCGRPGPRPLASWGCLRAMSQVYPPDWAPAGCYQLENWRAEPATGAQG